MKNISKLRKLLVCSEIVILSGAILGLSGCALGAFEASGPEPIIGTATPGAPMRGQVIGGQNPINGGKIYLFAAGQSAAAHTYGTGSTSLLTSAVLTNNTTATDTANNTGVGAKDASNNYYVATDSQGFFSISGDYSCPAAVNGYPAEVYLLAVGGNSGAGSNSNIALMAALGGCTSASQLAAAVPYVNINEITTIAAVWALQQFMGNPTGVAGSINIGAPTTNLVGLQNAFTMALNLANIASGQASPANPLAAPEADRIYTIGDILSYCVNSSSSPVATSCNSLFASVTPTSSALSTKGIAASALNAPADTIQAAWYLAQFPTNIGGGSTCGDAGSAFACIQSTGAPFTAMSSSPTDWTLAVGLKPVYDNSGTSTAAIDDPYSVVLDSYGNAWVDSISGTAGLSSVVPLSPSGAAIYPPVTSYPVGVNSGYSAYLVANYSTTAAAASTHTISGPRGMTVDNSGNVWLGDYNGKSTTGETAIVGGTGLNCSTSCYFGTVAEFPAATGIGTASSSGIAGYYSPYLPWPAAAGTSGNVYFAFGNSAVGTRTVGVFNSSGTYTQGAGTGTSVYSLAVDNNTSNTNGPNIWPDAMSGCTPAAGGESSIISQIPTGTITTVATNYGLIGAGNQSAGPPAECTTGVHDAIVALTGEVVGVSFDSSNNIWLVNGATQPLNGTAGPTAANNTVTYGVVSKPATGTGVYVNPSASAYASVASSAGLAGMNNPQYAEVDGSGNLWISNYGAATISEVNVTNVSTSSMAINSLSGANGFQHTETASALSDSEGIGIDLSGNVWVANSAGSAVHYMTVLVGAATPVGPMNPGNYGVAP